MKKSGLLVVLLGLCISSVIYAAGGVMPGSGTAGDPYLIEDLADFDAFADAGNAGTYWAEGVYTRLEADLDLGGRVYDRAVIAPYLDNVLDSSNVIPYAGNFDGNYHSINNLTINTNGNITTSVGLFGRVDGLVISLIVGNVSINANDTSLYIGGICGELYGSVQKCSTAGKVSGGGDASEDNHFEYATTGGLCGYNKGNIVLSWTSCEVNGTSSVGGFCGANIGEIRLCFATGKVTCNPGDMNYGNVGGFCGENRWTLIEHSYSTGLVLYEGNPGLGFCSWNYDGTITGCYWDIETSGCYYSDGGYGRLTEQMGNMETFFGPDWFFVNDYAGSQGVWIMEDYPELCWTKELVSVPDISNESPSEAGTIISESGLVIGNTTYGNSNVVATGNVIETSPIAGSIVKSGSVIDYVISNGAYPDVPNLLRMSETNAKTAIVSSGFTVGAIESNYSNTVEAGKVISQLPTTFELLSPGSAINLIVSLGPVKELYGAGTEDNPYRIMNLGDFLIYSNKVNASQYVSEGVYAKLECDLDLSVKKYSSAVISAFSGVFDGDGHVMLNLKIVSDNYRLGLFGKIEGENAKVCNLGLVDVEIQAGGGSDYVGALCGIFANGEVINCYSSGTVKSGEESNSVGGMCGAVGSGRMVTCHSSCTVSVGDSSEKTGGLCGFMAGSGEIINCYATGKVDGSFAVGGLCGGIYSGTIRYCYSTGEVDGDFSVGGFSGFCDSGLIEHSYASGNVIGGIYVGGFCGGGYARNSCAFGDVQGDERVGGFCGEGYASNSCAMGRVIGGNYVGGFCGYRTGDIVNSYCTGQIAGGDIPRKDVGGFHGGVESGQAIKCFWDVETSGFGHAGDTRGGSTGLTTEQMQTKQMYLDAGWDFEYRRDSSDYESFIAPGWNMEDGDYPKSQWYQAYNALPGKGSKNDPFRIETIADFDEFTKNKIYCHKDIYTRLTCDLDLSGKEYNNSPIAPQYFKNGTVINDGIEMPYSGFFEGDGHVIKNLKILSDKNNMFQTVGLFGVVAGERALVENLGVEDLNLVFQGHDTYLWDFAYGGICGVNQFGTVRNCYTTGSILIGYYFNPPVYTVNGTNVGGICGINTAGSIENSNSSCDISPYGGGGLCGNNKGGTIRDCYATGDITGGGGGLCFRSTNYEMTSYPYERYSPLIENCYATGNVSGSGGGGLVSGNKGTIINCHAAGDVTGADNSKNNGGLVGSNSGTIESSYATGAVSCGDNSENIGGLAGYNYSAIKNCYAANSVTVGKQSKNIGGLIGYSVEGYSYLVKSCFSKGLVSADTGSMYIGGLIGSNESIIWCSYSRNDILASQCYYIGGLCGSTIDANNKTRYCYSAGDISADGSIYVGGLTGRGAAYDSFWDMELNGLAASGGGEGKTTLEMKGVETYLSEGWDFVDETENGTNEYWFMPEDGYPILAWQMEMILSPDIDGNGLVNILDFSRIASQWLVGGCDGSVWCGGCDLDKSGIVDFGDIQIMGSRWLTGELDGSDGLAGYWDLDESDGYLAVDTSIYGRNGTVLGNLGRATGVVGGCYDFDGVEDYIEVAGYAGIGGGASRTIGVWIKADEDLANSEKNIHTIVSWGAAEAGKKWVFMLDSNTGQLALATYGGKVIGGPDLEDGQWHHVAVVLPEGASNLNQVRMYVDGNEIVTNAGSLDSEIDTSLTEYMLIGAMDTDAAAGVQSPAFFFKGEMDEVRIYNAEISIIDLRRVSLEVYYKFDEINSNTVIDSSDYGNHGTLVNGPLWTGDGKLEFDGADDYVEIEGYAGIGGGASRTIGVWIKADEDLANSEKNFHAIMSWGAAEAGKKWVFMLDANSGQLALSTYGGKLIGGTDLEDGLWHHVAVVLPAGSNNINQVKMYVDGVEIATNAGSLDAVIDSAMTEDVLIGAVDTDPADYIQSPTFFFKGEMDEVRIYNAAISEAEISEL